MITYETIRRVEEEERVSRKLARLPPRFVQEVKDYLEKKQKIAVEKNEKWEHETAKQRFQNVMELRERKIVNFTLSYVRSGAVPENMLPEEKELFDKVVKNLEEFHGQKEKVISGEKSPMKAMAFLQEIPKFVGIDMGHYGPYKAGDIATVPEDNAKLLLDKGAGEIIESS